jgi:SAM-dependent methyltransferase
LGMGLQMVDRAFRTLTGRRTRKMVERCAANAEYRLLDREVLALGATRVLDAGCGEGRVALTLGARHPGIRVDGLEVSATNVSLPVRRHREVDEGLEGAPGRQRPQNLTTGPLWRPPASGGSVGRAAGTWQRTQTWRGAQ